MKVYIIRLVHKRENREMNIVDLIPRAPLFAAELDWI